VLPDVAAKDTELQVDVRGRRGRVRVTRPPFVDRSPK
jgi:glycine cleavage system aminomethyltransferase T